MRLPLLFVAVMIARADAALVAVDNFGTNPGALDMFEYVPANLPPGSPVVVVMHGCTQQASSMEVAGWETLADAHQFAVLYPQQRSANQSLQCFDWYVPGDIGRGTGEAASVIQMIDKEIAAHGIDPKRVFVTGLSAGAAFTAVMLAAYPDRFAAGSIMSGLPYKCASDQSSATSCMQMTNAMQKTPAQWGDLVRGAHAQYSGPWPRVQIWQGSSDFTVYPQNATELVKQWTDVWGTDQTADQTDTISTATRTRFAAGNTVAVELYLIQGMGHDIATGVDADGMCPSTTGAYFADVKICSTLRAAEFFGLVAGGGGGGGGSGSDDPGSGNDGSGSDTAPPDDDDLLGGCDAGRGASGGGMLAGVALVALLRRRRRYSVFPVRSLNRRMPAPTVPPIDG